MMLSFPGARCFCIRMLYRELLQSELKRQRDEFVDFARAQENELEGYIRLLGDLLSASPESISELTEAGSGAIPSREFEQGRSIAVPFGERWSNHEQARAWASDVLASRTTFAADGSQLFPGKEVTLPVAAIQVGWFENPHDPGSKYLRDAEFRLLGPGELMKGGEEPFDPETRVGEERFLAEARCVARFIERKKGWEGRGERMPLAFFDGTLLVSFSLPKTRLQKGFIEAMEALVRLSGECRVPVVGYIDRSLARDVLSLLDALGGKEAPRDRALVDATFLHGAGCVAGWGDRTKYFHSNRRGLEQFSGPSGGGAGTGFVYLSTAGGSSPSRLDVPDWVFEAGLLDEVADVVRAECVVGLGYPYALETADATALISSKDRQVFLKALQDFALREKLDFSVSRKSTSKGRRR